MLSNLLLLAAGLVLLTLGADYLVRGAISFANRLGMPPLLIGLTVVGFGTSMPELLVSMQAALDGAPAIAVGGSPACKSCGPPFRARDLIAL